MAATAPKTVEASRRSHLASAGVFHFVCLFRRRLRGFPLWKSVIFHALRKLNRFACTRLEIPVMLGDDGAPFWFEYQGGFTDLELAHEAVAHLRAELAAKGEYDVQVELTEGLPLNGLLPEATGRYVDQDLIGEFIPEFYKERVGPVMCPFKRSLCTPDEVMSLVQIESLFEACDGVTAQLSQ